jgi:2-methylcitrate dehydratase PrpD
MAIDTTVASPTAKLAGWVPAVADGDVPDSVREAARWLILDHLSCAIGGRQLTPATILLDFYTEQGGTPEATVFATGARTSLLNAIYLNSALSNLLDFDDTYTSLAHPGGTVISPALNLAEKTGSSGRDVVTAVVLGYETMLRVIRACMPSPERFRKVAGLSVWQTLGATVVAGRLLGLDPERFRHALGLGAFNAPVPNMRKLGLEPEERPFSWTKNNYGWAAQGGVLGALLASRGFLGPRSILDGERGFWIMAGSDRFDPDAVTAGLGSDWMTPKTGFKPYASCRWTHTSLDCVRDFMAAYPDVTPADIVSIRLAGFFEVSEHLSEPDPRDIIDAQFSVRHVMALELLGRSARFGLSEADLRDPEVVDLRHRITVDEYPAFTDGYLHDRTMPVELTVALRNGEIVTIKNDEPWGDPGRPFSHHDIVAKYRALTEPIIGPAASERLLEGVLNLDEVESVEEILPATAS